MCNPVAAMAVGEGIKLVGAIKRGSDERKAHLRTAREFEEAASLEQQAGAVQAWQVAMKSDAELATARTAEAGSGWRADSASAERLAFGSTLAAEYRKSTIKANAARVARGYKVRAIDEIKAANDAMLNAILGGAGGALQGFAEVSAIKGRYDKLTKDTDRSSSPDLYG